MANRQTNQRMRAMAIGFCLLLCGLGLNYLLERHNIFKLWENSDYPISLADSYPPICFFLSLTGIVLSLGGAFYRNDVWRSFAYAAAVALPLTILYTMFFLAMQFVATGADRLGECSGLDQAATNSDVIPESLWQNGHAAVGCGVERRGIFLSYYNDLAVSGVTNKMDQQRVLEEVTKQYQSGNTHPVQVRFLEREKVSTQEGKNGVVFKKRAGPSKLIRVVNIG